MSDGKPKAGGREEDTAEESEASESDDQSD